MAPTPKPKSDLYREVLPLINSRRVELLDHPRLISQLTGLERRTARSGRDSIDHKPGAHDDIANACAECLAERSQRTQTSTATRSLRVRWRSCYMVGCTDWGRDRSRHSGANQADAHSCHHSS